MTKLAFILTVITAAMTIAANVLLRMGLTKAGGLGVSGRGFIADIARLALEPIFIVGALTYMATALLWFYVLSSSTLSVAYVMLVSMAFVGVTLLDTVIFGAPIGAMKIVGIGIILGGIGLVVFSGSH
ncbi:hypothetical protein [Dongia sp.]|uniref:hypothetical protein n=1 Tax=Dongia sp. TaxID=1977262 RepID=UPI0035B27D63